MAAGCERGCVAGAAGLGCAACADDWLRSGSDDWIWLDFASIHECVCAVCGLGCVGDQRACAVAVDDAAV